jgi:hypothetical protein
MSSWLRLVCLVSSAAVLATGCADDDLLARLNAIPGMTAIEDKSAWEQEPDAGYRPAHVFRLAFEQPVDHAHPEGAHFTQHMILTTTDPHAPMVQNVAGYSLAITRKNNELIEILGGNQVIIEHRYFGTSTPSPLDWSYLTLEQEADDLHVIHQALAPIFDGKWVATGRSKGGEMALVYRRFFPDDVDATVAYVAPVVTSAEDARFPAFVAQVGDDPACRDDLHAFQRALLEAAPQLAPLVVEDGRAQGRTFDLLGGERAFELSVLDLPGGFWQYLDASYCAQVPRAGASLGELRTAFENLEGIEDDASMFEFLPYYYQAATEMGWPAWNGADFAELLRFPGENTAATYAASTGAPLAFDPAVMQSVIDWAPHAERLMLIYGENDPWSAAMLDLGGARDSVRYVQPHGNHLARIADLAEADKQAALGLLGRWLDAEVKTPPRGGTWRSLRAEPREPR